MSEQLKPGQTAPEFSLPTDEGGTWTLSEHRGRRVVVYFYPQAATPGCTTEARSFNDNIVSLRGAGYDVVGVSPDGPDALQAFRDAEGLTFRLLSDADHSVMEAYGAWDGSVDRSTFVVDTDGTLVTADYGVDPEDHATALREKLGIDAPA